MDDLHYLHNSYDQTHRPAIIIVEDDPSFSKIAKLYIEKSFLIDVYQFDGPDECLEFIQQDESFQEGRFFCLVTDITFENQNKNMPGLRSVCFWSFLKKCWRPGLPCHRKDLVEISVG